MSQYSLNAATDYSLSLPRFSCHAEAEAALFRLRDQALADLESQFESLDFTAGSLKRLEAKAMRTGAQSVPPQQVGFYLGEVLCRNARYNWTVSESPFAPERYEIGVTRGLVTIMLTKGRFLRLERNKRLQSLWREYQRYAR